MSWHCKNKKHKDLWGNVNGKTCRGCKIEQLLEENNIIKKELKLVKWVKK